MVRPPRRQAFTLLELLIVLGIAAIILGLVAFNGRTALSHRHIDQAAQELKNSLGYARSLAVNTGGSRLELIGSAPAFTSIRVLDGSGGMAKQSELPAGVEISVAPSTVAIAFQRNGSLDPASLGTATEITMTVGGGDGSFIRVVTVRRQTGAVELRE
ncbi:MAG: prepilin-type N-terminal cleavage/methylation domain-containing protein [Armatimonadetes bacterium]|nr:prepilin-type N-terminal cleavage/methylation domain-containing protein [Armatimonadota bacterium]